MIFYETPRSTGNATYAEFHVFRLCGGTITPFVVGVVQGQCRRQGKTGNRTKTWEAGGRRFGKFPAACYR